MIAFLAAAAAAAAIALALARIVSKMPWGKYKALALILISFIYFSCVFIAGRKLEFLFQQNTPALFPFAQKNIHSHTRIKP